jgi:hypothetical protein
MARGGPVAAAVALARTLATMKAAPVRDRSRTSWSGGGVVPSDLLTAPWEDVLEAVTAAAADGDDRAERVLRTLLDGPDA